MKRIPSFNLKYSDIDEDGTLTCGFVDHKHARFIGFDFELFREFTDCCENVFKPFIDICLYSFIDAQDIVRHTFLNPVKAKVSLIIKNVATNSKLRNVLNNPLAIVFVTPSQHHPVVVSINNFFKCFSEAFKQLVNYFKRCEPFHPSRLTKILPFLAELCATKIQFEIRRQL